MPEGHVAVVGAGFVGLATSVGLASLGHHVVGADVDVQRVEMLSRGEAPPFEVGLPEALESTLANGLIRFVVGASNAVEGAGFIFLCLPTPMNAGGEADLSIIWSVVEEIRSLIAPGGIVVIKSTVPVGTAAAVAAALGRDDVEVVSSPEFLREGAVIHDFLRPSRIVVGARDRMAGDAVAHLFRKIDAPIIRTTWESAEIIKYASNSYLAMRLSFINSIAALADRVGADIEEVITGVGSDPRIGPHFLRPGPGWGGSCFPKDTRALLRSSEAAGFEFGLLASVIRANETQFDLVFEKIKSAVGSLDRAVVGVLGATFKAHTGDLRDSPALEIIKRLRAAGASIQLFDPAVADGLDDLSHCRDAYEAATGADAVVILTEWPEFEHLSFPAIAARMRGRALVDGRYLVDPDRVRGAGLEYIALGRQ